MIVTFFSFKGGVGRSFSLVETAVQLAARGRSVAVWDLDLEAPGLQKIPDLQVVDKNFKIGTGAEAKPNRCARILTCASASSPEI